MNDIACVNLRARRPHQIGHRVLAEGESLAAIQFTSAEDAKFFANHLRWSAFECVPCAAPAPEVVEVERPAPTLVDLIAAASPEQIAGMPGVGAKRAEEIIAWAKAGGKSDE